MEHQQSSAGGGASSVSESQTGTTEAQREAFSDPRAFIVRHERPLPGQPLDSLFTTQAEDGPIYIRVGVACSDAYLQQLWQGRRRFPSLTVEQLIAVRDGRVNRCEVAA